MQRVPNITGYRIEVVESPAPKDEDQIDREALGIDPPSPPPGPPTRMLQITLTGDLFPITERSYDIAIGDQVVGALAINGPGTSATGLLQRMPRAGEPIAFRIAPTVDQDPTAEPQVLVADNFDLSKLDDATG
jgi:hypothetical protein